MTQLTLIPLSPSRRELRIEVDEAIARVRSVFEIGRGGKVSEVVEIRDERLCNLAPTTGDREEKNVAKKMPPKGGKGGKSKGK